LKIDRTRLRLASLLETGAAAGLLVAAAAVAAGRAPWTTRLPRTVVENVRPSQVKLSAYLEALARFRQVIPAGATVAVETVPLDYPTMSLPFLVALGQMPAQHVVPPHFRLEGGDSPVPDYVVCLGCSESFPFREVAADRDAHLFRRVP
jgi:hypothetical protein